MNSRELDWDALLNTSAPAECQLKGALLTTYDRPDAILLAEHFLPMMLKLNHQGSEEKSEQQYYLLELQDRLKQLSDRLIIISTMARDEGAADFKQNSDYDWIFQLLRHLSVGFTGKAIQHSKLWMLHWGAATQGGPEYLELVVSSANLTMSGFKEQIQAAWRTCIELHPQNSQARLQTWGILPKFIKELGISSNGERCVAPFIELLKRSNCPDGINFFASVPGKHSLQTLKRTPWGAAGLSQLLPKSRNKVSVSILSPFVGAWQPDGLENWCARFGGAVDRLALVWIDKNHHWARKQRWILPIASFKTLVDGGATLHHLRYDAEDRKQSDQFHDAHRHEDYRWSHAKVYAFHRGNTRRVLLTSANFSMAAWGKDGKSGDLTIENFELGVCVDQAIWPLDKLAPFEDNDDVAVFDGEMQRTSNLISWAVGEWDGKTIQINCRCRSGSILLAEVQCGTKWIPIKKWIVSKDRSNHEGKMVWRDTTQIPTMGRLSCGDESISLNIFDARTLKDKEGNFPPGIDDGIAQAMLDELLFEQFGGRIVRGTSDDVLPSEINNEDGADDSNNCSNDFNDNGDVGNVDSYSVPAFKLARQHFAVVDNWVSKMNELNTQKYSEFERHQLFSNGEKLQKAFMRVSERAAGLGLTKSDGIGAKLAAQELKLRLQYFQES